MPKTNAQTVMEQAMKGQPVTLDWMEQDDDEGKVKPGTAPADPVKALELQIAELKGQIMSQNRNDGASGPQIGQRPNLITTPDWSKLPDPVTDAPGYAKAVQAEIQLVEQNKKYLQDWDTNARSVAAKATAKLHKDFAKQYPDYAKNQKAVEVFAEEVVQEAIDAGQNGNTYMFGQRDQFFKDVVAKMDEGGFSAKKALYKTDDDPDDGRASGIPDGSNGGGAAKGEKPAQPASMMSGLNKWRMATGHVA